MSVDSEGGLFGFFFADALPHDYTSAVAVDKERFNRFFHAMLDARRLLRAGAVRGRLRQRRARPGRDRTHR